jgi:hypothetical protein
MCNSFELSPNKYPGPGGHGAPDPLRPVASTPPRCERCHRSITCGRSQTRVAVSPCLTTGAPMVASTGEVPHLQGGQP